MSESDLLGPLERRLVGGYPKTGRTWLRYMLASYMAGYYDLDISLDLTNVYSIVPNEPEGIIDGQPGFAFEGKVPKIEMSHRGYSDDMKQDNRLVFLVRDPRDVMVSHWLHNTHQVGSYEDDLSRFLAEPDHGIGAFVEHLDSWAPHLQEDQIVTYESMRGSVVSTFRRVIDKLRLPVSEPEIILATDAGSLETMRKKEIEAGIAGHSYDRSDPEARRVRRGEIGGFVNYMSGRDRAYIDEAVAKATPKARAIISLTGYYNR